MYITSKNNDIIKMISSLQTTKGRKLNGYFIAEGIKLVKDAATFTQDIVYIVISDKYKNGANKQEILELEQYASVIYVSDAVYAKISCEITPQGILAVIRQKKQQPISKAPSVLLDKLSDPTNLGAIIRTCAAIGIKDVYLYQTADAYNSKSVRASMGGIYHTNLIKIEKDDIRDIENLVCAHLSGENIFDFTPPNDYCLAIGSESNGISSEVLEVCKKFVSIPMTKNIESLNAAVAASIILYQFKSKTGGF